MKAVEIARALGMRKRAANQILYGPLASRVRQDDRYRWHAAVAASPPPPETGGEQADVANNTTEPQAVENASSSSPADDESEQCFLQQISYKKLVVFVSVLLSLPMSSLLPLVRVPTELCAAGSLGPL